VNAIFVTLTDDDAILDAVKLETDAFVAMTDAAVILLVPMFPQET
jgi:hypothetical protein